MKIQDTSAQPLAGVGRTTTPESSPGARAGVAGSTAGVTQPAATVELSSRARELHRALQIANEAPDVRPDVVKDVRARISSGTYELDPAATARRMIDRRA